MSGEADGGYDGACMGSRWESRTPLPLPYYLHIFYRENNKVQCSAFYKLDWTIQFYKLPEFPLVAAL